jgi:hypothetical protein
MADQFTDAIALLKADHRTVEALFEKFETAKGASKKAIAEQICDELKIHTMLEEEIFYPAFKGKIDDDDYKEAFVEHDSAKVLINDLMSGGRDDFYDAKVKVLGEEIEHHIKEEEAPSKGLFSQCRDKGVDLVALRDEMLARKAELEKLAKTAGLPEIELTAISA